jgi:hypothetical protein
MLATSDRGIARLTATAALTETLLLFRRPRPEPERALGARRAERDKDAAREAWHRHASERGRCIATCPPPPKRGRGRGVDAKTPARWSPPAAPPPLRASTTAMVDQLRQRTQPNRLRPSRAPPPFGFAPLAPTELSAVGRPRPRLIIERPGPWPSSFAEITNRGVWISADLRCALQPPPGKLVRCLNRDAPPARAGVRNAERERGIGSRR